MLALELFESFESFTSRREYEIGIFAAKLAEFHADHGVLGLKLGYYVFVAVNVNLVVVERDEDGLNAFGSNLHRAHRQYVARHLKLPQFFVLCRIAVQASVHAAGHNVLARLF